jgi:anti-anti-sigma regulatory factor
LKIAPVFNKFNLMDEKKKKEKTLRLEFQGRLTVERAAELKQVFLDAAGKSVDVEVDLSGASEIDITFFQLLFAAHRAVLRAGHALVLPPEHPPAVQKALRSAGLCAHAGLCANTPEQCLWTGGDLQ